MNENGKALQLFLFTVQDGPNTIEIAEDVQMFLAYDDAGAIEALKKNYPALQPGHKKSIRKRAQLPIQQILNALLLPTGPELKIEIPEQKTKEATIKEFVYGMAFVADKYVDNARDRASIKRIMDKTLKRYESGNTPTQSK